MQSIHGFMWFSPLIIFIHPLALFFVACPYFLLSPIFYDSDIKRSLLVSYYIISMHLNSEHTIHFTVKK